MKKIVRFLLLGAAVSTAAFLYFRGRHSGEPGTLLVSGNIEATEAELGFKVPGRVSERLVDEGDPVNAGQTLARLDTKDLEEQAAARRADVDTAQAALSELLAGSRPQEIAQAEAEVQRAEAFLDALLAGSRPPEVAAAAANVDRQRADVERLRADAERQQFLYQAGLISTRENEASQTAYQAARSALRAVEEQKKLVVEGPRVEEIRQARAALTESRQRLALVRIGPRRETIDQARARLRQAQQTLALAQTTITYGTLFSPLTGLVLSKSVEPGEYVSPGTPVLTVADLSHVWLRAYVPETELGRVKVGQSVRVTTDTFPGKTYEGKVAFLSAEAEFTPKAVQTQKERVKLVYRVKIEVPNPGLELKPGMPADGRIAAP